MVKKVIFDINIKTMFDIPHCKLKVRASENYEIFHTDCATVVLVG